MVNPSKNILKMLPDYFKKSSSNMKELLVTGDMPLIEFDYGWMEFEITDNEAFVYSAYTSKNNTKKIWDIFIEEIKKQKCDKIDMATHRNPKVWSKLYNFNHHKSIMTLDLKGE